MKRGGHHVEGPKYIPTWYSNIEDDSSYLNRYKKPKISQGPLLSESPFELNTELFNLEKPENAEKAIEEYTNRILGCTPANVGYCTKVISVMWVLQLKVHPDCYQKAFELLLQTQDYKRLLQLYDELLQHEVVQSLPGKLLSAPLVACIRKEDGTRTAELVCIASKHGLTEALPPDVISSVVELLLETEAWEALNALVQHCEKQGITILTKYLQQYFHKTLATGKCMEAHFVFQHVSQKRTKNIDTDELQCTILPSPPSNMGFDNTVFNALLAAVCEAATDSIPVHQLLMVLGKWKIHLLEHTATALLAYCRKFLDTQTALDWFPKIPQQSLTPLHFSQYIVICGLGKKMNAAELQQTFREGREQYGIPPHTELYPVYTVLLDACFTFMEVDILRAFEIVQEIPRDLPQVIKASILSLYSFFSSTQALELIQELSITPSDDDPAISALDHVIQKSVTIDQMTFLCILNELTLSRTDYQKAQVRWNDDMVMLFGAVRSFTTMFCKGTIQRMSEGKSFLMVFDTSTLLKLRDPVILKKFVIMMNQGQHNSKQKCNVIVSFCTIANVLSILEDENNRPEIQQVLAIVGKLYHQYSWLKFLTFSNFLDCVLRTTEQIQLCDAIVNESTLLISWIEAFAVFYKQVFLVTENAAAKKQATQRKLMCISINQVLPQ